MSLANGKFKFMKDEGTWNAPSKEEERILALETRLQEKMKKLGKVCPSPKNERLSNPEMRPKALESPPSNADKLKPIYWKRKPWHGRHETTGGKCPGKWRCHKPTECKRKDFKL